MRYHIYFSFLALWAMKAQAENKTPENTTKPEPPRVTQQNLTPAEKRKLKQDAKKQKKTAKKDLHSTIKTMTLKELGPAKQRYLQQDQKNLACSCLERMITLDRENQQIYRTELADLYMETQEWIKAERVLKDFVSLYPNSRDTEYAYYKTCECTWQETLSPDRDQDKTRECLEIANKYLENEQYQVYRDKVNTIATDCYKKLLEHEKYVCRFYIKRGKCKSAEQRVTYMKDKLSNNIACEPDILVMECELAGKTKNHELLKTKAAELEKKYPQYKKQLSSSSNLEKHGKPKRSYARKF